MVRDELELRAFEAAIEYSDLKLKYLKDMISFASKVRELKILDEQSISDWSNDLLDKEESGVISQEEFQQRMKDVFLWSGKFRDFLINLDTEVQKLNTEIKELFAKEVI